jgi:N-acetylmuramoyl-L-alanine amidase
MINRHTHAICKTIFFFLLLFFLTGLGEYGVIASPSSDKALLQRARSCANYLYKSPAKKKYRHNWDRCIKRYERIYKASAGSDEAAYAMFEAGKLWTNLYRYSSRKSDLEMALSLYREIVDKYKEHNIADNAQYRIGEILYKYKKDFKQAYVELLKVEIKFPHGDARSKSSKMMADLETILEKAKTSYVEKKPLESRKQCLVHDIRHWSTPTYTRVVVDIDNPVAYKKRLLKRDLKLKKPSRLFVDIYNAWISKDIESSIPIKDGLLRRARAAQYNRKTVRVVLDIDNMVEFKIFHLYDPFRIVIDVQGKAEEIKTSGKRVLEKPAEEQDIYLNNEKKMSLAKQLGLGVRSIVIDPGHGGKDPGAIGPNGLTEKDVVLKLSKLLAHKIREDLRCETVLTRTNDEFLPLERRTAIANMEKADLFISLHTNAHKYRSAQGIETYFLNVALDEHSMNLAAKENATSKKNISDLQVILNDLMLNTKIFESSSLAKFVQQGLLSELRQGYKKVRDRGVRQAPFYVLIGAKMPAILVEIGYITNSIENYRLGSDEYLGRVASGIVKGIDSYIKDLNLSYKGG